MGNIASELSRAAKLQAKKEPQLLDASLCRALELIDLTIEAQVGSTRILELCRFREVVRDWYCGAGTYEAAPESLTDYALAFSFLQ